MQTKTDIITDDTHAVESATLTVDGKSYTAGGFSVDTSMGRMLVYPRHAPDAGRTVQFETWGGAIVFSGWITGQSQGFHRCTLTHYRGVFMGHVWHGKGLGEGMSLRLRRGAAIKSKSSK